MSDYLIKFHFEFCFFLHFKRCLPPRQLHVREIDEIYLINLNASNFAAIFNFNYCALSKYLHLNLNGTIFILL